MDFIENVVLRACAAPVIIIADVVTFGGRLNGNKCYTFQFVREIVTVIKKRSF